MRSPIRPSAIAQAMTLHLTIQAPSLFIQTHLDQLLPAWSRPAASMLLVLQVSQYDLLHQTVQTELEKERLRSYFLQFGVRIALQLQEEGYLADLFDPRTGRPLLSRPGLLSMDDVAVVRACLGYETTNRCGCSVLVHPIWGGAVYPSTLLSSAPVDVLAEVCQTELLLRHSYPTSAMVECNGSGGVFKRSEYHQSLSSPGSLNQYTVMTSGSGVG
jgi:hypothetical protein